MHGGKTLFEWSVVSGAGVEEVDGQGVDGVEDEVHEMPGDDQGNQRCQGTLPVTTGWAGSISGLRDLFIPGISVDKESVHMYDTHATE
jgi:hypothetical protein